MDSGVARKPLADLRRYARDLSGRLDPTANALDAIMESVREAPKRVVFAEGEEEKVVRAAVAFRNAGYGTPVLIGREERVKAPMASLGLGLAEGIEIHNARLSSANRRYAEYPLRALAAPRISLPRLPANGEPEPQRVRGLHGGDGRRRRDGDGADARRGRVRWPTSALRSTRSRPGSPSVFR